MQLVCGGDVMLGRGVNEMIRRMGPAYPLEQLQPLLCDKWVAVNLECAISSQQRQYSGPVKAFYFRADPRAVEVLREAGVRLVSLANNHALDADREGVGETLKILEKNRIDWVGAGLSEREAAAGKVVEGGKREGGNSNDEREFPGRSPGLGGHSRSGPGQGRGNVGGLRVGFLGACDHQRDFAATREMAGIRWVDPADPAAMGKLAEDVARLRERADAVVVSWHWQRNWEQRVRWEYRQAARRLVEAGATLIWGHGPHHFQGVEWLGDAAVLYSTGDLLDDYATDATFRNDYQLLFAVELQREGGRAAVRRVRAFPLQLRYARTQPADAEGRRWIAARFEGMCEELGSAVREAEEGWLEVGRGRRG